ncbi:MAG: hypothetical protein IJH39_04065 [Clostridia bacterium]|nr:hypothetical protein [Clostridia bacterium]
MNNNKDKKEMIQFIASLVVLLVGIVFVFLGFYAVPIGEIHYSVITVFGMFLTFVGAIWQIDVKYEFKTREMFNKFRNEGDFHQNDEN